MPLLDRRILRTFSKEACRKTKPEKKLPEQKEPLEIRKQVPFGHPLHEGRYKIWRAIFCFVCFPLIAVLTYTNFALREERERAPFIKYEYLRRITKPFPWGDGKRSFFHNPKINALPEGYEDEIAAEAEEIPKENKSES